MFGRKKIREQTAACNCRDDDTPQEKAMSQEYDLTPAEIQSGHSRVRWAENLILQMPKDHDGRNSWLINYGTSNEAIELRSKHPLASEWNVKHLAALTVPRPLSTKGLAE